MQAFPPEVFLVKAEERVIRMWKYEVLELAPPPEPRHDTGNGTAGYRGQEMSWR